MDPRSPVAPRLLIERSRRADMSTEKREGSGVPVAVLTALCLALAGIAVSQMPLVGSRPPARDAGGTWTTGIQDVPGRLWQDPFSAVEQYRRRLPQPWEEVLTGLLKVTPEPRAGMPYASNSHGTGIASSLGAATLGEQTAGPWTVTREGRRLEELQTQL